MKDIASAIAAQKTTSTAFMPLLAIWGAILFWGGAFVAAKFALGGLSPMAVMWGRMVVALTILLPFAGKLWPRNYRAGDWKLLVPLVISMPCIYFLLETNALTFTTASQAGVVAASLPLLVAVGAAMFLAEGLTMRVLLGLILSIAGVAWLTFTGKATETSTNPILGNMLEFGAMCAAAAYMLICKRLSDRYNSWTITAMQTVTGFVFFLPGAPELLRVLPTLELSHIMCVFYLGMFASLGAFGLYNYAISKLPASKASSFINLVPVVCVFFGWSILGETFTMLQMAGVGCVFIGVWLSQSSSRS